MEKKNKTFLVFFLFSLLFIPTTFANAQVEPKCETITLTEFMYVPFRGSFNYPTPLNDEIRRERPQVGKQLTLNEPIIQGERSTTTLFSNDTGNWVISINWEYDREASEPRELNINFWSNEKQYIRTTQFFTGLYWCGIVTFQAGIRPIQRTDAEVLELAGEVSNERFLQINEKWEENTKEVQQTKNVSGLLAIATIAVGVFAGISYRSSNKEKKEVTKDYRLMIQERETTQGITAVNNMQHDLDMVRMEQTFSSELKKSTEMFELKSRSAIQDFSIVVQSWLKQQKVDPDIIKPRESDKESMFYKKPPPPPEPEPIEKSITESLTTLFDQAKEIPGDIKAKVIPAKVKPHEIDEIKKKLREKFMDKPLLEAIQELTKLYQEKYPKDQNELRDLSEYQNNELNAMNSLLRDFAKENLGEEE